MDIIAPMCASSLGDGCHPLFSGGNFNDQNKSKMD